MKTITSHYTNTVVTAGRDLGAAKNNPGDNTGTGADKETLNDPTYGHLAVIESYRETGNSNADETLIDSDMRDAIEELASKKVSGISNWVSTTLYSTPNTLAMHNGFQFLAFNITGNIAKDPLMSPLYWLKSPSPEVLLDMYYKGMPESFGLHPIADRSGVNYKQSSLLGKYRLGRNGSAFYEFYMVALDGTTVTGDANLEAIFNVGLAGEYFNLDLIAPDNAGTRTLIDMSSRHLAPQSVGGENDVLGEVLEDRFQSFNAIGYVRGSSGGSERAFASVGTATSGVAATTTRGILHSFITDGTNGTPRTGKTTRSNELTVGSSYIIVMKEV